MVLGIYSAAIFISAMLLFGVQPLYSKIVLPKLGGSPAVWSLALVFFQAVLLLGYGYAHLLITKRKPYHGFLLHLCVLAAALVWLPISYPPDWMDVPQSGLTVWVLGLFAVGVGFPFFAVSANAPLLQAWFSTSGHAHARDPYFLYAASNFGSLLALVSYPFILEPWLSVGQQSMAWTGGFVILCLLIACCWAIIRKIPAKAEYRPETTDGALKPDKPATSLRIQWAGLAMVPSGLLVGVSNYITTDLASVPFLWVIPLAIFLVTFIISFSRNPVLSHSQSLKLHAWIVAPALPLMYLGWPGLYLFPLHLGVFFISSMVCHGELVKRRPKAERLTEFYLWMSFGGVLGGIFSSLIAPNIFDTVIEYPILLSAVFLCRGDFWKALKDGKLRQGWSFIVFGLLLAASFFEMTLQSLNDLFLKFPTAFFIILMLSAAYLIFGLISSIRYPVTQAGLVAVGLLLALTFRFDNFSQRVIETDRGFFGVSSVTADRDGRYHLLKHGTTVHGAERRRDNSGALTKGPPVPLTYYHKDGALAEAVNEIRNSNDGLLANVAVIGLGTGSMACHGMPGEHWRFFEIDPAVIRIARTPSNFRFLSECGGDTDIIVGDGRIMLEKQPDNKFDVIILDAFSSDSIPVHLITSEALAIYFDKLKPGGALVFHISNRYLELGSVVSSTAATQDAFTYISSMKNGLWLTDKTEYVLPALVAAVSKAPGNLGQLPYSGNWYKLDKEHFSEPWTDDYSNVLGAIYRNQESRYKR